MLFVGLDKFEFYSYFGKYVWVVCLGWLTIGIVFQRPSKLFDTEWEARE
jgi:hypothetical protein